MQALLTAWLIFTILTALIWITRHFQLSIAARVMPPLDNRMYPENDRPLPKISMLVAAKDERTNIETCLRSLDAQDYPDLEIIAVNDRSTDGTGAIINQVSATTDRIIPIHVHSLREGWFGKNNAMREGVERSTGEWLCFTDADCVQISNRTLRIAMNHALEKNLDFLSVLPAHATGSFWENVIQPACSGIMMIWFDPMRVNNPRRRAAYANGAFMLMKRSCYEAIGGHDAVKTELNEDIHMARRAKSSGLRLAVASNVDLYTVRMYESFSQTCAGWSRIFYGCFGSLFRLCFTGLAILLFSLQPWLALGVSIALLATGATQWPYSSAFAIASGVACLAQVTVMYRFYQLCRLNPYYALTYPIGAAIGIWAVFGAIRRLRGRAAITWRGTTYRAGRVDSAQECSAADDAPIDAQLPADKPLLPVSE